MKSWFFVRTLIITIASLIGLSFQASYAQPATHCELVFLNWSEYMDPGLISEFENTRHCQIKQVYFDSDDGRDDLLITTNTVGYDVAIVNGVALRSYVKRAWLAPITEQLVPNLRHIEPRWLKAFEGSEGYTVPFFWGTLGIAYRKDLTDVDFSSWMNLYRPAESIHKKIVMMSNSRDLIGMGLKALGYSANSMDPQQISQVEQLLSEQKPHVRDYGFVTLNEKSSMISGEVVAAMMYSGDALMLSELEQNVSFVVPHEGSNLWVDYLVVLEKSRQKALAYDFINFLNEPKNAARLAGFLYYATPNMAAEKLLPDDHLHHPIIYPDKAVLERSEVYINLSPTAQRTRNSIHSSLIR